MGHIDFEALNSKNKYVTSDGLVWYEDYAEYQEGAQEYKYIYYMKTSDNSCWAYKILFGAGVNYINFDNIITYLLDSVETTSY